MAQGKNKKLGGKKGAKKKIIDPLTKKQWFQLKAPVPFKAESFGFTCANKSQGLKKVQDAVRGRVVSYLQADLATGQNSYLWRKIRLIVDDVQGRTARTSFYGLDTTRDELCYLIRKWRTLIETYCDCKTNDGYILRVFTIAFTKKSDGQKKVTNYALSSQVKAIRRKIVEILNKEISKSNVTQVLTNFTTEVVHDKITKEASKIYPLENVKIRKIKVLQRPKIDSTKLNEMHDPEKRRVAKIQTKKVGATQAVEAVVPGAVEGTTNLVNA